MLTSTKGHARFMFMKIMTPLPQSKWRVFSNWISILHLLRGGGLEIRTVGRSNISTFRYGQNWPISKKVV